VTTRTGPAGSSSCARCWPQGGPTCAPSSPITTSASPVGMGTVRPRALAIALLPRSSGRRSFSTTAAAGHLWV